MNRSRKQRLQNLAWTLESMPIAPEVEKTAFDRFRETGELPEYQRLAAAVTKRALRGPDSGNRWKPMDFETALQKLNEAFAEPDESKERSEPVCKCLFDEAVYGWSVARWAARLAIRALVADGWDVTDSAYIDDNLPPPQFGSVGLHLLGFPDCLAKPPYEDQARRLLGRFASVRRRVPSGDERWFRSFAATSARFFRHGELPEEDFMCEAVLVYGESLALGRNLGDEADSEVLAAFDEAARSEGEERDAAIERLQELAAEGRIP